MAFSRQTIAFSVSTATAAGLLGALAGAGINAQAGVPGTKSVTVDRQSIRANQTRVIEELVRDATCADLNSKLEGCDPKSEASEVTIRWDRNAPMPEGPPALRVSLTAKLCKKGTWKRNNGAGVQIDNCAVADVWLNDQQKAVIEGWLSDNTCDDLNEQIGSCDVANDIQSVSFRWDRSTVGRDPLNMVVWYLANGTWVRSAR